MPDIRPRPASKAEFGKMRPQVVEPKARTWITRAGNFAVAVSEVESGAVLTRDDNPEEYMVILPPHGASARIEAGGDSVDAHPDSLTIVPPGPSKLVATSKGDRKSTRLNSSHYSPSRMPSSA